MVVGVMASSLTVKALLALALLVAPAGCVERLPACETLDGEGHWVAVRAVWNGTAAPAPGACMTGVHADGRVSGVTDELGIAVFHLAEGRWEFTATLRTEDDPLCANQGRRTLDVTGAADVVVRLERDAVVCA